jgi:hypothetical protein
MQNVRPHAQLIGKDWKIVVEVGVERKNDYKNLYSAHDPVSCALVGDF